MTVANPGQPQSASTQAIAALILGILSVVAPCCAIVLGPIAWYLGHQEGKAIREGRSPAAGEGLAKAGMILGIIGTILMVLGLLWAFFMGGMAILQGLMAAANS
jgi:cytochrome c biogenesis protein CcdA